MEGADYEMKSLENHRTNQFVQIAIPYEVLLDSGINFAECVQFSARKGGIVIEQILPSGKEIGCSGECDTCPMLFRCCNVCTDCPCTNYCDKNLPPKQAKRDSLPLIEFLDHLSEKEQHEALVHLSLRWAEKRGGEQGV